MSKLELILLGQFECLLPSGTRISLSMRKAEVLLAYLALTPGLRHPRERLINLLWSDRSEEQARNSLRQCLSAIRKSLGDVAALVLQVDRTTVSLIPELIDIDVHEFERLAAEGDYESLTTAADLYQGEFLEGISIRDASCQEWLDSERARFKRQFIEILSELAETQLLSHDFGHAIKSAERLVKQDPLGESGWRILMRSYYEHGDRNHALMAFNRCSDTLRKELNVEPETATVELRDQIAGGEASPAPKPTMKPLVDSPASSEHSIAVLPFDNLSGDPEQEYFSDGITDSIILNLSAFPDLQVKSRNSSFAFKQQIKSLGEISQELEVDYIVEGSIRKSADRIRITVQLIEAASGNQVWGKRYDAEIEDLFDLEEELSRSIAATVTGQIDADLQRIAVAKGAAGQESYDLLLSGIYHAVRFNRQDSLISIEKLNQCLAQDPDNVRAHVHLYSNHSMNHLERWVEDHETSFQLAAKHIQRALALDPESALVQTYYAEYLIFNGEKEKALKHINKALEINPGDPDAMAVMALYLELHEDFEAALEMAEHSYRLDPYHPWVEWELAVSRYFCGQYEATLETIENARTSPSFTRIFSVAANIKLGRTDAAKQELQAFLHQCRENMLSMPATLDEWIRYFQDNYLFGDPRYNQDIVDCLLQAGLEEALVPQSVPNDNDVMPSIAVLPFENMSGDPEQEYFADGITNDIVTMLSHIRRLRVVARHSTMIYKDHRPPISEIAEQQDVRYILDGSVRKSGKRIRVNVQLIDSHSGENCWAENYDRKLKDIFAVQDEITRNIAVELQVHLISGESARDQSMGTKSVRAWELVSMAWDLQDSYVKDNMLKARQMVDEALVLDPEYSSAWVVLGWTHWQGANVGFSESIDDSINQAMSAAERALALNPDFSEALVLKGCCHVTRGEPELAVEACSKAVEISPGNAEVQALTSYTYNYIGAYDKSLPHHEASLRLCPVCPNWFLLVGGTIYQHTGDLEKAIETYRKGVEMEPESPLCRFYLIDALIEAGREKEARVCADEIRALDNSFTITGMLLSHSHDKDVRDRYQANLEKVGFKI